MPGRGGCPQLPPKPCALPGRADTSSPVFGDAGSTAASGFPHINPTPDREDGVFCEANAWAGRAELGLKCSGQSQVTTQLGSLWAGRILPSSSSDDPQLTRRRVVSLSERERETWRSSLEQPPPQTVASGAAPGPRAHLVQQGEANPLRIFVICDHHSGQPVVPDVHVAEVLWAENSCQRSSGKGQSLPQRPSPPAALP